MEETSGSGIGSLIGIIIYLAVVVLFIVSAWKLYEKAGKPGWAAIVPIYNLIVLLEIIGRPTWWVILYFVPCVGLVVLILNAIDLAKSFGKSAGYGILIIFGIGYPLLAFSDAKYVGPAAKSA
ncbi:signal peptidase I [Leptospira wolffii]|uniref:DUF5684 domain-containing protein n=1 Tax=Leptospira wolffii TaxID=409998 RepID=UPI0003492FC0|nr:DUF5684 domain-containing protein [Leptospira wolffii]TGK56679.1 signal peptidase I [Leptospira wolffii]TGK71739.1 signal peptidase I [Leptospira wolffii]TGK75404.1 signal peptidase I [Leptospira wolffii]TGL33106.1 signal peptidase I [Leptospira wolffii]